MFRSPFPAASIPPAFPHPAFPPPRSSYSFDIPSSFNNFSSFVSMPMESLSGSQDLPAFDTSAPSNHNGLSQPLDASPQPRIYEPAPSYPDPVFQTIEAGADEPMLTVQDASPPAAPTGPQSGLRHHHPSHRPSTQDVALWVENTVDNGYVKPSHVYEGSLVRSASVADEPFTIKEDPMQIDDLKERTVVYDDLENFPAPSYPAGYQPRPTESLAPHPYSNQMELAMPSPVNIGHIYGRNTSYSYSYSYSLNDASRPSSAASIARSRSPFARSGPSPYAANVQADDEQTWNLVPFSLPAKGFPGGRVGGPHGKAGPFTQGGYQAGESAGMFLRSPTPTKRQRTSQACEKCRDRKAKCTGTRPSCARCAGRGIVCEYSKEKRVRGPPRMQSSVVAVDAYAVTSTDPAYRTTGPIRNNSYDLHGNARMPQSRIDTSASANGAHGGPHSRVTSSPARMRPYPASATDARALGHSRQNARTRGQSQGPQVPLRHSPLPLSHGLAFPHRLKVEGNGDFSTSSGTNSDSDDRSPHATSLPLHPMQGQPGQTPEEYHRMRVASGSHLKVTVPQVTTLSSIDPNDSAPLSASEPPSSATSSSFAGDLSPSTDYTSSRRPSNENGLRHDTLRPLSTITSFGTYPRPSSPSSYDTPPEPYVNQFRDYPGEPDPRTFYHTSTGKWYNSSLTTVPATSSGFSTGSSSSNPSTSSPGSFVFHAHFPQDPSATGAQWAAAAYEVEQGASMDTPSAGTYRAEWHDTTPMATNDTEFRTWIADDVEHPLEHSMPLPQVLGNDDLIRAMGNGDAATSEILSPTMAKMQASLSSGSLKSVTVNESQILDQVMVAEPE